MLKVDYASVRTSFICVGEIDDIVFLNKRFLTQFAKKTESPLWCMIELSVLGLVGVFFFLLFLCFASNVCVTPSRHTSALV